MPQEAPTIIDEEPAPQPPLRMIAEPDKLTFITPAATAEVSVHDLVASGNGLALIAWAMFCQLRDTHHELKGINSSLQALVNQANDPQVVGRIKSQAEEAVQSVVGMLKKAGMPMPPGFDNLANLGG